MARCRIQNTGCVTTLLMKDYLIAISQQRRQSMIFAALGATDKKRAFGLRDKVSYRLFLSRMKWFYPPFRILWKCLIQNLF